MTSRFVPIAIFVLACGLSPFPASGQAGILFPIQAPEVARDAAPDLGSVLSGHAPELAPAVPGPAPELAPTLPDPVPESEATRAPDHRSPAVAGLLEPFLPTLGYAYAGDWRRGLLPAGVRVVGVGLIVHGLSKATVDGLFGGDADCGSQCSLGLGMFVVGTVWGTVGAARTARSYNLERGREVSVHLLPARDGVALGASYRF